MIKRIIENQQVIVIGKNYSIGNEIFDRLSLMYHKTPMTLQIKDLFSENENEDFNLLAQDSDMMVRMLVLRNLECSALLMNDPVPAVSQYATWVYNTLTVS